MNEKVCKVVTDRIIALIEEKQVLVWSRCWDCAPSHAPMNFVSKKPYSGINWLLCSILFPEQPYFLSYHQAKKLGGQVKKGEKGVPVLYYNFIYFDEEGKKVKTEAEAHSKKGFLKYSTVFNQSQVEGIDFPEIKVPSFTPKERIAKCEAIIKLNKQKRGLEVKEVTSNEAFYSPSLDSITMPKIAQFKSAEQYYGVLFHEMVHWTGHQTRLDRFKRTGTKFGSKSYSAEELVAEIGAASLASQLQIQNPAMVENSAAYVKGWLARLKADSTFLVQSAKDSQKAVDLITAG